VEDFMPKLGHSLRTLRNIDPDLVSTLRDELSVSTAEEFLHFVRLYPRELENLLHVDRPEIDRIAREAKSLLEPTELAALTGEPADDYPYRTGHDAPTGGLSYRKGG
jgi:hypothetical protein